MRGAGEGGESCTDEDEAMGSYKIRTGYMAGDHHLELDTERMLTA